MPFAGKLVPLDVPWMVSPSVPAIRLTVIENGDAIATFDVAVLPESDLDQGLPNLSVEVRFQAGQWTRTAPSFSDHDVLPPDLFDQRAMPTCPPDQGFDEYLRTERQRWAATGVCFSPGIYEVHDSRWLVESGAARFGCRHYVVEGHDMWLEVLALGFSWKWSGPARAEAIDVASLASDG